MEIEVRKEDNVVVAGLKGRMDAVTAPEFDRKFAEWVSGGANLFVFNLNGLEYISSAGLRSILASAKQLKEKEGKVVFAGIDGPVKEVFELSGFYSIFDIYDTEETAISRIK